MNHSSGLAAAVVRVFAPVEGAHAGILSEQALDFLASLAREFEPRRQELLAARKMRQKRIDAGEMPDFLPETASIREREWTVAPIPADPIEAG